MNKERFIISFAAALAVCLLIAGYTAMTATYTAAEAPPVPADYMAEVLTHTASPDTGTLPGKPQQTQSVFGSGFAETVSIFAPDAVYAKQVAEACGEVVTDWTTLSLTGGEKIYLAKGSFLILRKGCATCIESANIGLTDVGVSHTLEQGDELAIGTLYTATVPAAGLYVSTPCTAILSGDYSLS